MNQLLIVFFVAAFAISATTSFLSGSFLRGLLLPILCFLIYLFVTSAHQGGWKIEGFLTVFAYAVALLLMVGLPIALVSALGAVLGVALSKRTKDASGM